MECTSESLGAVLRAFCPCGLVRQALNYILRGVRIGADRVKITLFLRGAERVHVPTVPIYMGRPGRGGVGWSPGGVLVLGRGDLQFFLDHSHGIFKHTVPQLKPSQLTHFL